MGNVIEIGQVPWTREDMIEKLEEFTSLYEKRPIEDNTGGMKSSHIFFAWFALQVLNPKAIIESGVWRGQGTWFFEKACPYAQINCIDLNLNQIQYKSKTAKYFDQDFSTIDWSCLPKDETVLFFDDHQNAYDRIKTAKWFGFKHMIFEDNYPSLQGDCYSLKKAFMHSGFKYTPGYKLSPTAQIKKIILRLFGIEIQHYTDIPSNDVDDMYLRQNLKIYYEFPPIFKPEWTRWNDLWDDVNYPTPKPLLSAVEKKYQQIYLDEAIHYTWMCYAKLK